jgi:predicted porin
MKKHLIAAAVAAAVVAPAAMAQVSISGYMEAAFDSTSNSGTTADTKAFTGAGMFGSPRLVFSGSEDLGGGLKAGFRLESSLDIVSGRLGAATLGAQSTTGPIFDRGVEVNLSGAFGTVAVGKLDHWGIENNDLNVVGNISLFNDAVVEVGGVASDVNGTIRYTTPVFNGISVNVSHTPEDDSNSDAIGGSKAHGGITAFQATGSLAGVSFRIGGGTVKDAQTAALTRAAGSTKVFGLGLAYNFGVAEASLQYQTQENPSRPDAEEYIVSVKVPLGGGWDVRANYSMTETEGAAATTDRDRYAVGVVCLPGTRPCTLICRL